MHTYRIEEMTWQDIQISIAAGKNTIIIPIAAIEQHGPSLPLITDTLVGEVLSDRVAAQLGDTLVAPAIRVGCSDQHLSFAGSLSVSAKLLEETIEAYCASLARHGFKNIVLLPVHGGNFASVNKVTAKLKAEYDAKGINIIALSNLREFINAVAEPLYPYGYSLEQIGRHAGAAEAALVLALRPDLVHQERFQEGFIGNFDIAKATSDEFKAVTPNGILGDQRGSTAEMGQKIMEFLTDKYTTLIQAEKNQSQ